MPCKPGLLVASRDVVGVINIAAWAAAAAVIAAGDADVVGFLLLATWSVKPAKFIGSDVIIALLAADVAAIVGSAFLAACCAAAVDGVGEARGGLWGGVVYVSLAGDRSLAHLSPAPPSAALLSVLDLSVIRRKF